MLETLPELIDHLGHAEAPEQNNWRGWRIEPVTGRANNLLYHAIDPADSDLAIKFYVH